MGRLSLLFGGAVALSLAVVPAYSSVYDPWFDDDEVSYLGKS